MAQAQQLGRSSFGMRGDEIAAAFGAGADRALAFAQELLALFKAGKEGEDRLIADLIKKRAQIQDAGALIRPRHQTGQQDLGALIKPGIKTARLLL